MSYRPHGHAEVDPNRPRAWATCDRCGFLWNHYLLSWERQWSGPKLIRTGFLVCPTCLDQPQEQLRTIILPPDPVSIRNSRPEPYAMDEAPFQILCEGGGGMFWIMTENNYEIVTG